MLTVSKLTFDELKLEMYNMGLSQGARVGYLDIKNIQGWNNSLSSEYICRGYNIEQGITTLSLNMNQNGNGISSQLLPL